MWGILITVLSLRPLMRYNMIIVLSLQSLHLQFKYVYYDNCVKPVTPASQTYINLYNT